MNRLAKELNNLYSAYDKNYKPLRALNSPTKIDVETTNVCEFGCEPCPKNLASVNNKIKPKNLSLKEFRGIINEFPSLSQIILTGDGEPLSNPDVFDIIKASSDRHVYSITSTNAMLLKKENSMKIIESGLGRMQISIDAGDKSLAESIRRGMDFERICENIEKLVELKKTSDSNKPELEVNTVVTKRNMGDVPNLTRLCERLGIRRLLLQFPYPLPTKEFAEIMITKKDWLNVQKHEKNAEKRGITVNYFPRKDPTTSKTPCEWPWTSTFITANGEVLPCCYFASFPERATMGNIFEENFNTIWNNRLYRAFREGVKERSHHFCQLCPNMELSIGEYETQE